MGYVLFTSSGSFNPATYGLQAGDNITIVAVGGGGGGGYYESGGGTSAAGKAGGTTKFGSIVSSAGGSGGSAGSTRTVGTGQFLGAWSTQSWSNAWRIGGAGGYIPGTHNWGGDGDPGVCSSDAAPMVIRPCGSMGLGTVSCNSSTNANNAPILLVSENSWGYDLQSTSINTYNPRKNGQGRGYGAGGGGARDGTGNTSYGAAGGNSGIVKRVNYTLTSTSAITVTIGAAGSAGKSTNYGCSAGTAGCVEVFW